MQTIVGEAETDSVLLTLVAFVFLGHFLVNEQPGSRVVRRYKAIIIGKLSTIFIEEFNPRHFPPSRLESSPIPAAQSDRLCHALSLIPHIEHKYLPQAHPHIEFPAFGGEG